MAEAEGTLADLIREFFRNTKTLSDHPRLGPVAGSSRAGCQQNSDLEKNSTISELNCLTTLSARPLGLTRKQKAARRRFVIDRALAYAFLNDGLCDRS
jgi:hypothetical protein